MCDVACSLVSNPLAQSRLGADRKILPSDSTVSVLGAELLITLCRPATRLVHDLMEAETIGQHRQSLTNERIPGLRHVIHAALKKLCCLKITSLLRRRLRAPPRLPYQRLNKVQTAAYDSIVVRHLLVDSTCIRPLKVINELFFDLTRRRLKPNYTNR